MNVAVLAPNDGTARSIADVFGSDSNSEPALWSQVRMQRKRLIQYVIDGKQSMTVFKDVRTLVTDAMGIAVDVLDEKNT